jgi:dihydrolipoamide dehydrogenase
MRVVVIGAGPGGYVAALKAARFGATVTVIEDTEVGGTCLNRGCIPTKTLLASSEAFAKARQLERFGIELKGTLTPNLTRMMERKDRVVGVQVKGIRTLLNSWGITLVEGVGRLLGGMCVEARRKDGSTEAFHADKIIIATGSRPAQMPAIPTNGTHILSSDDAFGLREIPRSMIIVGAGVIGCEWACIFGELGTEITIVETLSRAIATEDEEISGLLAREFKKRKIRLLTNVRVESVSTGPEGVSAILDDSREIKAEKMLLAVGRALNTEGLGLETLGIAQGEHEEIRVDDRMQTNVEDVYAVGDVTGGILLAHVASREGIVAASNACGQSERMRYETVPTAIFTLPEIASVGLREFQAEYMGIRTRTGHFPVRGLGKAHALGEIAGLFKVIADYKSDRVLGVHIIGARASDVIHEAALALAMGLSVRDIAGTIHAHLTLSEGLVEAAEDVYGEALHVPKR